MKILIILGIPRSGTTVLASALGGHPEISMINEGHSRDFLNQVGTRYVGNKVACDGMLIEYYRKRLPVIGAIFNRIINLGSRKQGLRLFPNYDFSLNDLVKMGATFIIINRTRKEVISSIMQRGKFSKFVADLKYDWGKEQIETLKQRHNRWFEIEYIDLVNHPVKTLTGICRTLRVDESYVNMMINGSGFNETYKNQLHGR